MKKGGKAMPVHLAYSILTEISDEILSTQNNRCCFLFIYATTQQHFINSSSETVIRSDLTTLIVLVSKHT